MTVKTLVDEEPCSSENFGQLAEPEGAFAVRNRNVILDHGSASALRPRKRRSFTGASLLVFSAFLSLAAAQASSSKCISLSRSRTCPAFNQSSISTSDTVIGEFPFLAFVADTNQFDTAFEQYIKQDYAKKQYGDLFGCSNLTLSNTTNLYARFTTSVLCSKMVQLSKQPCSLTDSNSTPICADSCAQFAISEQIIVSNTETCGQSRTDAMKQMRADFTVCSLPPDSITNKCIQGEDNESTNCGYSDNLPGLCLYCSKNSPNSTDTCCYGAGAEKRCENVQLPTTTSLPPIFTGTSTSSPTSSYSAGANVKKKGSGLSAGAIAGATIGAIAGVAIIVGAFLFWRRRRMYEKGEAAAASVFNQPTRQRRSTSLTFNSVTPANVQGYEVLPGARIARMSALETNEGSDLSSSPQIVAPGRGHRSGNNSSSSDYGLEDSPISGRRGRGSLHNRPLHPPPRDRNASLSSSSILNSDNNPTFAVVESDRDLSSPEFPQSEQLPYFKDYYSNDDIHPHDSVATLWAYAPRAADEFELERGDMLKVIGIWDDGWATGVRLNERAEDFSRRRSKMRDSGISASQTSRASQRRVSSPPPPGEVKAFPLVCVCLPEHWQKTIESDAQGSELASRNTGDPPEMPTISGFQDNKLNQTSDLPERRLTQKGSSRFREDLNVPPPGMSSQ